MRIVRQIRRGIQALLRSRQADADVDDEIAQYLEEMAAEHAARGLSVDEARRAARLEMSAEIVVRERVRASGWEHAVESKLPDARRARRRLRRSPGARVDPTIALRAE